MLDGKQFRRTRTAPPQPLLTRPKFECDSDITKYHGTAVFHARTFWQKQTHQHSDSGQRGRTWFTPDTAWRHRKYQVQSFLSIASSNVRSKQCTAIGTGAFQIAVNLVVRSTVKLEVVAVVKTRELSAPLLI